MLLGGILKREQISFSVESECVEAGGIRNEPSHPVTPVADGDCKVQTFKSKTHEQPSVLELEIQVGRVY